MILLLSSCSEDRQTAPNCLTTPEDQVVSGKSIWRGAKRSTRFAAGLEARACSGRAERFINYSRFGPGTLALLIDSRLENRRAMVASPPDRGRAVLLELRLGDATVHPVPHDRLRPSVEVRIYFR